MSKAKKPKPTTPKKAKSREPGVKIRATSVAKAYLSVPWPATPITGEARQIARKLRAAEFDDSLFNRVESLILKLNQGWPGLNTSVDKSPVAKLLLYLQGIAGLIPSDETQANGLFYAREIKQCLRAMTPPDLEKFGQEEPVKAKISTRVQGFTFDGDKQALYNGKDLELASGRAVKMLKLLTDSLEKIIPFEKINKAAEQYESTKAEEATRSYVADIRKTLKQHRVPYNIMHRRGAGYILQPNKKQRKS